MDLLYVLHKFKDGYISGEELANKFNVSRTTIWNNIDYLRKQGYTIEAHPNLGYRLIDVPDRLLPDELQYGLNTKVMGKRIYAYEEVGSTNDIAWEMALKGEPEGSVVFAESQTKGRGRLKRKWFSPKRKGLWFSVILRPQLTPNYAPMITAVSAVAVSRAIARFTGLSVWIKWPNDIYVNEKKAGGILTELNTELDTIKFVILGIGINVNVEEFPDNIKATSLKLESGKDYSRIELAKEILTSLEYYYNLEYKEVIDEWKKLSLVSGKRVRVGDIEGQALGIDEHGSLIIRMDDGIVNYITSGDVICC